MSQVLPEHRAACHRTGEPAGHAPVIAGVSGGAACARSGRPSTPLPTLTAERYADLLLLRPPADSRAAAMRLLDQGLPARAVYLEVLAPALHAVGLRWQRGRITIAQEHLATAVVRSVMATLAGQLHESPPVGRRIVLACTGDELHDLGLRMVADFLEADGWEVYFLGASTPGPDLLLLVDRFQPAVVGLSATCPTHLASVGEIIAELRGRQAAPFVLVGGTAYAGDRALARSTGADAFAADAGSASAILRAAFGHGVQGRG